MRRWAVIAILYFLWVIHGCRWPGSRLPVSQSLAASRQLSQRASVAMESERWEEAERLLAEARETCPEDPDACRQYAEVLWHNGRHEDAVRQMTEAARLSGRDPRVLARLAEMQHQLGRSGAAERTIREAADISPGLAEVWAVRGRLLADRGRFPEALAAYHRALGLAPHDVQIARSIAEIYLRLGQPEKALAAAEGALRGYPPGEEPASAVALRADACLALGRYQEAIAGYAAACLRAAPSADLLYRLARAQAMAGRSHQAIESAQQALAIDPGHGPSRQLLQQLDAVARAPQPPVTK